MLRIELRPAHCCGECCLKTDGDCFTAISPLHRVGYTSRQRRTLPVGFMSPPQHSRGAAVQLAWTRCGGIFLPYNKMSWPGSIKPVSSVRTPTTANSKQLNSSSSSRPSTCLHDAAHTMGSIPTYIVLATASLSMTYLAFLLYSAYGFAAFKAAAPFIGTVTVVFGESSFQLYRGLFIQPYVVSQSHGYVQDKREVRVLLVREFYPPLLKWNRLS